MSVLIIILCSLIGTVALVGLIGGFAFVITSLVRTFRISEENTGSESIPHYWGLRKFFLIMLCAIHLLCIIAGICFSVYAVNHHLHHGTWLTDRIETNISQFREENTAEELTELGKEEILLQSIKVMEENGQSETQIEAMLTEKFGLDNEAAQKLISDALYSQPEGE